MSGLLWAHTYEIPIVVIIPSYNNKRLYKKNLRSVFEQQYTNYSVVYIDDCSSDGTGQRVARWCRAHRCNNRWIVIRNSKRRGSLANIFWAVHTSTAPHEIVVILDGDDYFSNAQVLSTINRLYQVHNIWTLYGQFQNIPSGKKGFSREYPTNIVTTNSFRKFGFCAGAPRTFYSWLMRRIAPKDLQEPNDAGQFFMCAGDVVFMFPILEMAGIHHTFYDDVLYLRTTTTGIHDFLIHKPEQERITQYIKTQEPYHPLEIWQYGAHTLCAPTTLQKIFTRSLKTLDIPLFDYHAYLNNNLNNFFYESIQEEPQQPQEQELGSVTNDIS